MIIATIVVVHNAVTDCSHYTTWSFVLDNALAFLLFMPLSVNHIT